MNYDFDVLSVTTDAFQTKYSGLLARFGMAEQARKHYAMLRDPAAIQALAGASQEVRDCFLNSGFGLTGYDSGAGKGHYREADVALRELSLARLRRNVERLSRDAGWNGFDIEAFFEAADAATPAEKVDARFSVSFLSTRSAPRTSNRATTRALSTPASAF